MPKKTRRQKALSEERREKFLLEQAFREPRNSTPEAVETIKTDYPTSDVSYFTSDLKRSLIIVLIVITLEIIVYFGTINRYFGN